MSGSSEKPWSNNPNAPQIPYSIYFAEKAYLAGNFIGAIQYGTVIILFFRCMSALLNPINHARGSIRWGLVAYTAALFSILTINVAMSLNIFPISYIDNRGFPGTLNIPVPGPYGYQWLSYSRAASIVPSVMFLLNTCLADGFLLYRCYIIYSKNYLVIVIPSLMYLASLTLSVAITYFQATGSVITWNSKFSHLVLPYYLTSLSLNILLTLMIVTRLIHIRNAIGSVVGGGLYNTVVTMLVESCVLYAVFSLLLIGPLGAASQVEAIFRPSLGNIQVIASFLIILRVANRTALTSDVVASGKNISSIHFKSPRESAGDSRTLPDWDPMSSMETSSETLGNPSAVANNITEDVPP